MTAEEGKCPIWGNSVKFEKTDGEGVFDSPRAGGKYKLEAILKPLVEKIYNGNFTVDEKIKLTDWLIDQRKAGVEVPLIDVDALQNAKARSKKMMQERVDRFIFFLAQKYEVGEVIVFGEQDSHILMAHSSSYKEDEVFGFRRHCVSKGYLYQAKPSGGLRSSSFYMTVEGKMYAEGIGEQEK